MPNQKRGVALCPTTRPLERFVELREAAIREKPPRKVRPFFVSLTTCECDGYAVVSPRGEGRYSNVKACLAQSSRNRRISPVTDDQPPAMMWWCVRGAAAACNR